MKTKAQKKAQDKPEREPRIKKREGGGYSVALYLGRETGRPITLQRRAGTLKEARALAKELKIEGAQKVREAQERAERSGSVEATVKQYLNEQAGVMSPKTLQSKQSRLGAFVGAFGAKKLGKVTGADLAAWRDKRLEKRAPSSVAADLRELAAFFSWALCAGLLDVSPLASVRKPSPAPVLRKEVWEGAQVRQALADTALPLGIRLLLVTGARPEEIQVLEWHNVTNGQIRIEQVGFDKRGGGIGVRKGAKNAASVRVVELGAGTAALLEQARPADNKGFVIGGKAPKSLYLYRKELREYCQGAGLPEIPLYALRRTAVTYALDNGTPLKAVSARVGHKDTSTTLRSYAQVTARAAKECAELFG